MAGSCRNTWMDSDWYLLVLMQNGIDSKTLRSTKETETKGFTGVNIKTQKLLSSKNIVIPSSPDKGPPSVCGVVMSVTGPLLGAAIPLVCML